MSILRCIIKSKRGKIFERLNKGEHLSKRDLTNYYGVGEKTIPRDIDDIRNYLADKHGYEPDATVKFIHYLSVIP